MTDKVDYARQFGRVAVLMGGDSSERAVSLNSGQAVCQALLNEGVDATAIDVDRDSVMHVAEDFDRAFIALHGGWGEDGTVQGLFDLQGFPYTGSGVMGCAIAMDKARSKLIWQALDLPTAPFNVLTQTAELEATCQKLGFPVFMKPTREGSSVGVGKALSVDELQSVWDATREVTDEVLIEAFIPGAEITIAVLNGVALPPVMMSTPNEFYDYDAKYASSTTHYECPAPMSASATLEAQRMALAAFSALGCRGWGRVDLKLGADNEPILLEVNTVPGMTATSLVPMAATQAGYNFGELCVAILARTLDVAEVSQ